MTTREKLNGQLIEAAEKGDTAAVKKLIADGADVHAKDDDGETALFAAARNGHADAARALIEAGAEVDARDEGGGTALRYAAYFDHTDTVRALVEGGADVNAKVEGSGTTALMAAALRGSASAARILIEAGADANAKTGEGKTALMTAARFGRTDAVKALLEGGADVNARDEQGGTALSCAVEGGWDEIVAALVAAGAQAPERDQPDKGEAMILHDVMKRLTLIDLESIVACMYERDIKVDLCKEHGHAAVLGLYMDFVQRLCRLTPTPNPEGEEMALLGYPQKHDPEDEDDKPRTYVDVTLYKQAQLRELDPGALAPNAFLVGPDLADEQVVERLAKINEEPGEWDRYAYDMTPWEEILGYEVSWDNICRCGLHAFMAEVLGEMSYYGFDREGQDEHRETVAARYAESASRIAAMKRAGMSDEEIARALETGELPESLGGEEREAEEAPRAGNDERRPDADEDDGAEAAEEHGGSAPEDLSSLMEQLSELARMEGASKVVMPAELLSAFAPKSDGDGQEDGGQEKQWYTLEEMAAKHGIDLEELERKRREKETPAFIAAKNRVLLWNCAQERLALLHWLGASPTLDQSGEEEEED